MKFTSMRRATAFVAAIFVAGAATTGLASPQGSYPAHPIRLVVPFPAGGAPDMIAREVANKVATQQGWTIVIENKPGSGGNLGVDAAAKAKPDGYTLLLGQTSNLAINPSLYAKMPYNAQKDLTPIGLLASAPLVLAVSSTSPYQTLAEVLAAAKAKPEHLNYASSGSGTVAHLAMEQLQKDANVRFTHIPYKGAAQGATDLIGGQVQMYISSVPTLMGHIRGGKMRGIVVTSSKRTPDLPAVPTVAESGFMGFEAVTWFGIAGPAGLPKDVVATLNAAFNKALAAPDVRQKLAEQGSDVPGGTAQRFADLIRSETSRWAAVVKQSGAKLD